MYDSQNIIQRIDNTLIMSSTAHPCAGWRNSASQSVDLNPILAVNIGASAPLILGVLSGQVLRIDHGSFD